jgi:hypothetical protein
MPRSHATSCTQAVPLDVTVDRDAQPGNVLRPLALLLLQIAERESRAKFLLDLAGADRRQPVRSEGK